MFERIKSIIKETKTIPNTLKKQKQLSTELIARYSNGNVSLQRGNYITKDELLLKEQNIFSHKFI